ncbi:MAG TPA: extracellular solute-binding protein [Chloroflexota bacterium]|nr:extracellular solute-binding protein [Chloroflexota bacterium]
MVSARASRRHLLLSLGTVLMVVPTIAACSSAQAPVTAPAASGAPSQPTAAPASVANPTTAAAQPTALSVNPTAVPTAAASGQPVTITFMGNHDLAPAQAVEKAVQAFQQANPNIHVNWSNVTQNYNAKLETMAAGGDPPDMYRLAGTDFAQYAYRGFMLPLDDYMARDKFDKDDFYPVAFSQYQWNGKQLGLSSDVGNRMVFYNGDLWKKASLALPLADWSPEGWTFDDFRKTAISLTQKQGGKISQFGFVNVLDWMTWPLANGGWLWNADTTDSMVDKPEAIEAFQFLQDLMFKDQAAETKDQQTELNPSQAFLTGKAGMTISSTATGTTTYRQIKAFTWNVIAMPRGPSLQGDRRVFGGGSGWMIYRLTKQPDATWKLFSAMESKQTSLLLAAQGFAPARLSTVQSDVWLDPKLPPASKKVVTDGPKYIVPFPKATTWNEWVDAVNKQLDLLWLNKISAKDLAPKLKEATDPLVKKHLDNLKNAPKF